MGRVVRTKSSRARRSAPGRRGTGSAPLPGRPRGGFPRSSAWASMRVAHGNQRVVLAPDDERRQLRGQVEPVGGAHALAAQVDDPPHRVQERPPGLGLLERDEAAPRLLEVGARAQPEAPERVHDPADALSSRHAEPGQHHFGSRQRRRPEQRVDLATEAAARHQDEALAALGKLVGELHGDAAAQRVPDDRPALAGRALRAGRGPRSRRLRASSLPGACRNRRGRGGPER